ncbi:lipoprotein [Leptospira ryugenii]|uniref:Lipoprotein n=1 Tax=Leptospira ryugenii TaxID=1917863 RepID=A0A2P2E1N6_9LEPT|nr:cytochrome c [Leptospira ryugenii]GBF50803.1 lipoprotein [Leptospira ryugenii]
MKLNKLTISLSTIALALFLVACGDKPKEAAPTETAAPAVAQDPEIAKGEEIFLQNCASCHGEKGAGDGAAAAALNPKPRNFKAPANEWKNGNTVAAITKTLNEGIKGSPMVAYKHLGNENIALLAKYVEYLGKN